MGLSTGSVSECRTIATVCVGGSWIHEMMTAPSTNERVEVDQLSQHYEASLLWALLR